MDYYTYFKSRDLKNIKILTANFKAIYLKMSKFTVINP